MKRVLIMAACISTSGAVVGEEFVNLTFDQPDTRRVVVDAATTGPSAPVGDLLRGWEVSLSPYIGVWKPYRGLVNLTHSIGSTKVALSTGFGYGKSGFGVSMQAVPAISISDRPDPPAVRLSTKGTVPSNAIFFEWHAGSTLEVMVSDGSRQVTVRGNTGILNIAQFAGTDVTISFELKSGGYDGFDVIGFTQTPTEGELSPPRKLTHTTVGKESVTLTWAPSTDPVLGYELFSSMNLETPFTNRVSGEIITDTVYTYTGADATGRFYQVRAVGVSTRSGAAIRKYSSGAIHEVP